jgi:hypothetical protein
VISKICPRENNIKTGLGDMEDKYIDWWLFGNRFHLLAKETTGGVFSAR